MVNAHKYLIVRTNISYFVLNMSYKQALNEGKGEKLRKKGLGVVITC